MIDLLLHTSLFKILDNGCLLQLNGVPLYEILFPDIPKHRLKPSEINISRHKIFYNKPVFYSNDDKKLYAIGLPPSRTFNFLYIIN